MNRTPTLPPLDPFPEDIEDQLRHLLKTPSEPSLEPWLLELIKFSGHMSTGSDMRWRLLCIIWLAAQFDLDTAWPYLMWLNMNEPILGDHLSEILVEALDDFDGHLQLANWIANSQDERLKTLFSEFRNIPALRKMPVLFNKLLAKPTASETGVWLAAFCDDTAGDTPPHLHSWRLLAVAWYATCFNPTAGLTYLQEFTKGAETLSAADNKTLMDTADEINGVSAMIQWIAACPDRSVRSILKEFGHYDLAILAETTLREPPNYDHLRELAGQASADAQTFKHNLSILEEVGLTQKSAKILDLACGPLAPQTVLLSSIGYKMVGVDLHIPPAKLPLPNLKYWLKRNKHVKAWQNATAPYYHALAQQAGLKLKWNKVKIKLANLTRLEFTDKSFEAVICVNYLEQAPDVDGLLAEAARVLQPGGLLLADIRPYASLTGAFQPPEDTAAWGHLRRPQDSWLPLNKWRAVEYRAVVEKYFTIEQWQTEPDEQAQALLTPEIRVELADYSEEELTRKQIVILARKKS